MNRRIECRLRQQQTIRCHDQRVGAQPAHALDGFRIQALWLIQGHCARQSRLLNGARYRTHTAAGGPIGLRED
jgi:hypothetical protein